MEVLAVYIISGELAPVVVTINGCGSGGAVMSSDFRDQQNARDQFGIDSSASI